MTDEQAKARLYEAGETLLRELAKSVADLIGPMLPEKVAFMVVLTDEGPTGSMVYASNVARPEIIALLGELREKLIEGRQ